MNNPIKQHTNPQLCLKFFADKNEMLWVLDIKKHEIRKQRIKDTTILRDFYTLEIKPGVKDYKIEKDLFANGIEKEFAPVVDRIIDNKQINDEDRDVIFRFVLFQFARTKKFNDECQKFVKQKIGVTPHKNTNIKGMLTFYKILFETTRKMSIILFETKGYGDEQYITSDDPVVLISAKIIKNYYRNSPDCKLSLIYFPLSPNLSILINDYGKNEKILINKKTVDLLNGALINQADQYIISRGRKNLLKLMECDNNKYTPIEMINKIKKYLQETSSI